MKKLLLCLVCAWAVSQIWAAPRSEREARRIAETFLKTQSSSVKRSSSGGVSLVATSDDLERGTKRSAGAGVSAWYVYNQGVEAFVLVSGDDRMPDILGYSTDGAFVVEGMPSNLRAWLENYTAWADALQVGRVAEAAPVSVVPEGFPESVAPLLGDISYDQLAPYNSLCPEVDGEQSVTGCVATAMASILSYWKYPEHGTGSYSYTTMTHEIPCSFDFGSTVFDWENILPIYAEGEYTDEQAEAIATLMYACGVAADMDYSASVSGAFDMDMLTGMIEHFGFNPYALLHDRVEYSSQEWMELVCGELSAGHPLYYGGYDMYGGGHAFVVDGYDRNGMVHVNWGWGGSSNGYFNIATLDPYTQGIGGGSGEGFAFGQIMATGLVPATVSSVPRSSFGGLGDFYFEDDHAFISDLVNHGGTFNGNLAIVAERDGMQTVISELMRIDSLPTYWGWNDIKLLLSYPEEAGTFRVYVGSRADGEVSWTKVRGDGFRPTEYVLTMREDGTHELVEVERRLVLPEVGRLSCDSVLYAGCLADISLPVSNPLATDYLVGYMDFYLREGDGADSLLGSLGVVLSPGEEHTETLTISLPDVEGTCTISTQWRVSYVSSSEPVGQDFTVEIRKGVVTDEVNLRSARLDHDVYMRGDTVTCTWQVDLDGLEGDVFSQWFFVAVYPKEFGSGLFGENVLVTVEQGIPGEFSCRLVADLEPGEYRCLIINGDSLLWTGYFTVAEAAGIVSARPDAEEAPEWCPSYGGTELCFRYAKEVERVAVYDVAGRLVRTAGAVRGGNGVYAVDGSGLPRGQYVMRIPAADGTVAVLKFLR